MAKTALVAGTTGLIGSQLVDLLLADSDYEKVIAISRKPVEKTHAKLDNLVCELKDLPSALKDKRVDVVFCCLGTTMRKAKTKEAFRAVDYDAPIALAKVAKENGAKKCNDNSAGFTSHAFFLQNCSGKTGPREPDEDFTSLPD